MRHLALSVKLLLAIILMGAASAQAAPAPASFAPLAEKLSPAVVNISTTQRVESAGKAGMPFMFQLPDDPQLEPFREFFEQFNQRGGEGGLGRGAPQQDITSLGSGFIIDPAGYVVTNNHVIAKASEVSVILQDDTSLVAEVVGRDPKTDIALLKVKSDKPLPYVTFGNSDQVRVGDWIVAIGNPFGLGGTVTAGIISARSRSINAGPFDDFLQTDAAINRGNSGGPMFNMQGEVIGVNTAIFSPSGGNIGIGFAVPASLVKPVIDQLREHGRTYRGWLGVKIQAVTDEMASALGLPSTQGALVLDVTKDSPAAKTDLKSGDVILTFDGKSVSKMRNLPRIVAETKIGRKVPITYWREGKKRETIVELGELDEGAAVAKADDKTQIPDKTPKGVSSETINGVTVAAINPAMRQRYRLGKSVKGLIVTEIAKDSKATKQNIRVGDVIYHVNATAIETLADYKKAMSKAETDGREYALVKLKRGAEDLFITLPTK